MTDHTAQPGKGYGQRWRILGWGFGALLLLAPLVAMQFTDEVQWSVGDFVIASALILVTGGTFELLAKKLPDRSWRAAVGLALLGGFLLLWINGAVGIIGSEDHDANMLYLVLLAAGALGGLFVRFQPRGMQRVLIGMAAFQIAIAVPALLLGWGASGPIWPRDLLGLTLFFATLWLAAAILFRHAARAEADRGIPHHS
ncbi:MAG TPA: hypothetical protein PK916_01135 [Bacteroidota bacterium]|nr:hypothetical protein [Bacteroidota bacterium]